MDNHTHRTPWGGITYLDANLIKSLVATEAPDRSFHITQLDTDPADGISAGLDEVLRKLETGPFYVAQVVNYSSSDRDSCSNTMHKLQRSRRRNICKVTFQHTHTHIYIYDSDEIQVDNYDYLLGLFLCA